MTSSHYLRRNPGPSHIISHLRSELAPKPSYSSLVIQSSQSNPFHMHFRSYHSSAENHPFYSEIKTRVLQWPYMTLQGLLNFSIFHNSLISSLIPFHLLHSTNPYCLPYSSLNRTSKVLSQGLCKLPRMLFLQKATRVDHLLLLMSLSQLPKTKNFLHLYL